MKLHDQDLIPKVFVDKKISKLIFSGFTIFLFGYIVLRAYFLGFTHDESITFTITDGDQLFLFTANNHWLNTLFSYLSSQFFGFSELAFRLPNVISFLVYSFFCYKLVIENSTNVFSTIISIIFLMLNPYLIDFFGLSRGYGLSMAFFCGSLYFFIKDNNHYSNRTLAFGLFFSILTIYANFSFIIPIIAIHAGYFNQINLKNFQKYINIKRLLLFSLEAIFLVPALFIILLLKKGNRFYYGGSRNIIQDTLFSIFDQTFLISIYIHQNWCIMILFFLAIAYGVLIKKRKTLNYILIVVCMALVLPVFLHFFLGIKYAIERAALYWIVIFGVYFHFFLEQLIQTKSKILSYLFSLFFTGIGFLIVANFLYSLNLDYAYQWKYDASTRSMLQFLDKRVKKNKNYRLGIDEYFEPVINHYRKTKNYNWLEPVTREGIKNQKYDYYYIFQHQNINISCKKEIKRFKTSNSKLIKSCSK